MYYLIICVSSTREVVTFDPAVSKEFYLGAARERTLQVRVAAFNVFNRANFALPTVVIASGASTVHPATSIDDQ